MVSLTVGMLQYNVTIILNNVDLKKKMFFVFLTTLQINKWPVNPHIWPPISVIQCRIDFVLISYNTEN